MIAAPGFTAQQSNDNYLLGVGNVLVASAGITATNVAFKRLAGNVGALMAAGLQLLIGMVPLGLIAALTESPREVTWSPKFVLILFSLALPGTSIVYWLWLSTLETLPLNRANAHSFLVPSFGLSLGIAFYGEALSMSVAVGASLAFLGIFIANRSDNTKRTPIADTDQQPVLDTIAA